MGAGKECWGAVGSCLRRNDGRGRGDDGGVDALWRGGGGGLAGGGGSRPRTPHLTSPLEGGRDELGKGGMREAGGWWDELGMGGDGGGSAGSCLRRNDGGGAGMAEGGRDGGRGAVGSCLRRNDGRGRGNDGMEGEGFWVVVCGGAGMGREGRTGPSRRGSRLPRAGRRRLTGGRSPRLLRPGRRRTTGRRSPATSGPGRASDRLARPALRSAERRR